MPMSRYDYEQQHISDAKRINELEKSVTEQARANGELKLKMNYLVDVISLLMKEKMNPSTAVNAVRRKPKLTEGVLRAIKTYRNEGQTQKQIAEALGISIGLVNKACNLPSPPQA